MPGLQGKVALVTGASRGIGAAIARRLAADGAKVAVNYSRSREAADAVVRDIRDAGGEAIGVQADLSDAAQVAAMIEKTVQTFGRLDILINNAAVSEPATLDEVNLERFARHFDLNVRGLLLATKEAVKHMPAGGRIINITSGIVKVRAAGNGVYAGSKAAVEAITRCLSAELGPRGITINCVAPGITDTDMLASAMPPEAQKALIAQTALGRMGKPQDIADVVAFVAADDARWITGEVIPASGGLG